MSRPLSTAIHPFGVRKKYDVVGVSADGHVSRPEKGHLWLREADPRHAGGVGGHHTDLPLREYSRRVIEA